MYTHICMYVHIYTYRLLNKCIISNQIKYCFQLLSDFQIIPQTYLRCFGEKVL